MSLFQLGSFSLHSGLSTKFKIECDSLADSDWAALAALVAERARPFSSVEGVPRGGVPLAKHLELSTSNGGLLIVDDVYTTGRSMEEHRNGRDAQGFVVFARTKILVPWVKCLFQLN